MTEKESTVEYVIVIIMLLAILAVILIFYLIGIRSPVLSNAPFLIAAAKAIQIIIGMTPQG